MINIQEKTELFSRVIENSCQTEAQTQLTYKGIHEEYLEDSARSTMSDVTNNKKVTLYEKRKRDLDEKRQKLTIVENQLATLDPTDIEYKPTVVKKNRLVFEISDLEVKVEEKATVNDYIKQISNIMLDAEAYFELELLHHIKDHAEAQGWVLDTSDLKDLKNCCCRIISFKRASSSPCSFFLTFNSLWSI